MTKRVKIRFFFLAIVLFSILLNSIVEMHPKGVNINVLTSMQKDFNRSKYIVYLNKRVQIDDPYNKIIEIYGISKNEIDIKFNQGCRTVIIKNRRVELKTKKRTLKILNHNKIDGIGRQFFGIIKRDISNLVVDEEGYFLSNSL